MSESTPTKKGKCSFQDDEEELDEILADPSIPQDKNCYIFIVDRSGSMGGQPMEQTKKALLLFIQSLPKGSLFQILSFGSRHQWLQLSHEHSWDKVGDFYKYNDGTLKEAK